MKTPAAAPSLPLPIALETFCAALEAHVNVSITDVRGKILYVNPGFCHMTGYAPGELLGQTHRKIRSGIHAQQHYDVLWKTIAAGMTWQGDFCNCKKNGDFYWVKASIVPVRDAASQALYFVSVQTDITSQKQQALKSEKLIHAQHQLLEIAPVGIAHLDRRRFLDINQGFCDLLGYDKSELVGEKTRLIYFSDEQFAHFGHDVYGQLQQGQSFRDEVALRHKNGSTVWVVAGVCTLTPEDPLHNTLFVLQDITAQKRMQADLAQALAQSKAAEHAKAVFIDSMTHQIRTPLNGILGAMQLLDMENLSSDTHLLIDAAVHSANRLLHMVDAVLEFAALDKSTPGERTIESCTLNETLSVVVHQAGILAQEFAVTVDSALSPELAQLDITTDQRRWRQLLSLLLDNAIRYNHRGGKVTVSAQRDPGTLVLDIVDTGIGMAPEDIACIGKPFVRINPMESIAGVGLGLALSKRLAEMLGATLEISSASGRGTRVRVLLALPNSH